VLHVVVSITSMESYRGLCESMLFASPIICALWCPRLRVVIAEQAMLEKKLR
jgi:hypothetical protein